MVGSLQEATRLPVTPERPVVIGLPGNRTRSGGFVLCPWLRVLLECRGAGALHTPGLRALH